MSHTTSRPTTSHLPKHSRRTRRKHLSNDMRRCVVSDLLQRSTDGVPRRGAIVAVAIRHAVHPRTVSRVWHRAKQNNETRGFYAADSLMTATGRHPVDHSTALERRRAVPLNQRSTIRAAAAACGIPVTTLGRRIGQGDARVATSVTKPRLTDDNKQRRLLHCLSHVYIVSCRFDDMFDVVHVDEKLFYVTEVAKRFVLLPDEPVPERSLQSKRHISKVMLLAAVARPRWDAAAGRYFDGKVGIWPFIEYTPAARNGRNKPAGTLVLQNVSVTKSTYCEKLITNLLPALASRWPRTTGGRIVVQQDNAAPHIDPSDPAFIAAAPASGLDVELKFQPNSPDMNVCDLGVFNAVQARQKKKTTKTMVELVVAVTEAFWKLPSSTLNSVFLSLQATMESCMKDGGGNNFRPAHISKGKLAREGRLPVSLHCSRDAVESAVTATGSAM